MVIARQRGPRPPLTPIETELGEVQVGVKVCNNGITVKLRDVHADLHAIPFYVGQNAIENQRQWVMRGRVWTAEKKGRSHAHCADCKPLDGCRSAYSRHGPDQETHQLPSQTVLPSRPHDLIGISRVVSEGLNDPVSGVLQFPPSGLVDHVARYSR